MNAIPLVALWLAVGALTPVNEEAFQKLVSSHKGTVVAVNVWATWCAPCRAEMPALVAFEKRHSSEGFVLVLVSANDPEEEKAARQFLEELGVTSQPYIKQAADDQKFIDSVDPKWSGSLPATFIYDRSGKRIKSFFGEVDIRELEALLRTL
jgi:thiol-disulfide isomerase/thioredoxin